MSNYKKTIIDNLTNGNYNLSETQQRVHDRISSAVDYAWNNWDNQILAEFYTGEKPEMPTSDFIQDWVENEDFEADGYDVDELQKLFGGN